MVEVIDLTQDENQLPPPHLQTSICTTTTNLLLSPSLPSLLTSSPSLLPSRITPLTTSLPPPSHRTLLRKRTWLQTHTVDTSSSSLLPHVIPSTLLFAQEEAGSAVCISPRGLILSCAHCVAESRDELSWTASHWLLFSDGRLISARLLAWDPQRDLSLLLITRSSTPGPFPYTPLSPSAPKLNMLLFCTGQPGSLDLEVSDPDTPTRYDLLVLSTGSFRGLDPSQDPQDNSEIGALKHTCWTYWGHSGAPLTDRRRGRLVGMHSSWDEETGMRRGVAWEAIVGFLEETREKAEEGGAPEGWTWFVSE